MARGFIAHSLIIPQNVVVGWLDISLPLFALTRLNAMPKTVSPLH